MCPFFSNGDRYEVDCGRNVLSITLQHWQDVKLGASACSSCMPNFVQCSAHSCSEPGQKRDWWQRQDSWKPSHGSISNQGFCQHKVSGVCQPQTFSAFNIVKDTLFIDLTLCENRYCEENGSLAIVTGRHPHVCSVFSSCDRYELDCCTNVLPIAAQHWQDIEMQRDSWRRQDSWKP